MLFSLISLLGILLLIWLLRGLVRFAFQGACEGRWHAGDGPDSNACSMQAAAVMTASAAVLFCGAAALLARIWLRRVLPAPQQVKVLG